MKTQNEIESSIVQAFGALQTKIKSFSVGTVIRSLITAISAVVAEVWNDLVITTRKIFWTTAQASDLDALATEEGLVRLGANAAQSIVVFRGRFVTGTSSSIGAGYLEDNTQNFTPNDFINGKWILIDHTGAQFPILSNTNIRILVTGNPGGGAYFVLPKVLAGTVINSSINGLGYTTQTDVIVGAENLPFEGLSGAISIGSATIVTCQQSGSAGQSPANSLTILSPAINGVTSVTNPVPTNPRTGLDQETDEQLRARRKALIAQLSVDTQAFYEGLAIEANANVLRAVAQRDPTTSGVKVIVASRNGAAFSGGDLTAIADYITARTRSFDTIAVVNMILTEITVSFTCTVKPGVNVLAFYVKVADAIANILDYSQWDFNTTLIDDTLLEAILQLSDLADLSIPTFIMSGTYDGGSPMIATINFTNSLPQFVHLKITELSTSTTIDLAVNQLPIAI